MRWLRGPELQNLIVDLAQGDSSSGRELETGVYPSWDAAACNLHSGINNPSGSVDTVGLIDLTQPQTEFDASGESSDFFSFL
jgi:hypothetical protein